MLLIHKENHLIQFPVADGHRTIYPGLNEVEPALVDAMSKHPSLKHRFDEETLEVVQEAGKPVDSLLKIKPEKAKKMITATVDLALLNKWLESDDRAPIQKAIREHLEAVEKADQKPKKDQE